MPLAAIQANIQISNTYLSVAPNAVVSIRDSSTLSLVPIYSDRDGFTQITNPTTADVNGFFRVYTNAHTVNITATLGAELAAWNDVILAPVKGGDAGDGPSQGIFFENGKHHISTNDGGGNFNIRIGHTLAAGMTEDGFGGHLSFSQATGEWSIRRTSASQLTGQAPVWDDPFYIRHVMPAAGYTRMSNNRFSKDVVTETFLTLNANTSVAAPASAKFIDLKINLIVRGAGVKQTHVIDVFVFNTAEFASFKDRARIEFQEQVVGLVPGSALITQPFFISAPVASGAAYIKLVAAAGSDEASYSILGYSTY